MCVTQNWSRCSRSESELEAGPAFPKLHRGQCAKDVLPGSSVQQPWSEHTQDGRQEPRRSQKVKEETQRTWAKEVWLVISSPVQDGDSHGPMFTPPSVTPPPTLTLGLPVGLALAKSTGCKHLIRAKHWGLPSGMLP